MKKILSLILTFILIVGVVGCSNSSNEESVSVQIGDISTSMYTLNAEINNMNMEIENLKKLIPSQGAGTYTVNASKLNMRQGPSTDDITIGTIDYGSSVSITDSSNPLWVKVSINLSQYTSEKDDYSTKFTFKNNTINIKNQYLDDIQSFYVSRLYLSNEKGIQLNEVPKGENPFVYGLIFYDDKIDLLLENEIWNNMKTKLEKYGYTGVDVIPVNRDTYDEIVKTNQYDAVESAPGQFASANKDTEYLKTFAKDIIGGTESYSGIMLVNKNTDISNINQIKGKTVLTGKEYSESSYLYQKYYLNKNYNIDIEKDLNLQKDLGHQEIFYKVAIGEADVGFCGDFVMTNSYGDMKESLENYGINLDNEEQLKKLRNNVRIIFMDEEDPIPNNPHSIITKLYSDEKFVNSLYNCVKNIYSEHKENYDIMKAENKEYDILKEIE